MEKQVNDRARAAAGHGSSSNLFGAFFAWKKFLYVFSVDKELSLVETWKGKSVCGGSEGSNSTVKHTGVFFKDE